MTSNLIANITNKHELPMHSQLSPTYQSTKVALASQIHAPTLSLLTWLPPKDVSNMHTKEYGLDLTSLNHPCRHPSNFSTITGIPQQIEHGKSLTSTYQHAPGLPEMNPQHHRIFKASLNGTREKMKEFRARQLKQKALYSEEVSPPDVLVVLPAIMDKRSSMALMKMSRINESNRIKNAIFKTALHRKHRILIIDNNLRYKCRCGSIIDQYGDHCLGCKVNHKAKASKGIRDEITKVFQRILHIVSMIESPTQVEREVHNVVPSLPSLKPFDLSI
jgi:hypothetical protein